MSKILATDRPSNPEPVVKQGMSTGTIVLVITIVVIVVIAAIVILKQRKQIKALKTLTS